MLRAGVSFRAPELNLNIERGFKGQAQTQLGGTLPPPPPPRGRFGKFRVQGVCSDTSVAFQAATPSSARGACWRSRFPACRNRQLSGPFWPAEL